MTVKISTHQADYLRAVVKGRAIIRNAYTERLLLEKGYIERDMNGKPVPSNKGRAFCGDAP